MGKVSSIDLEKLPEAFRLQRLVFQAARKAFAELSHGFSGTYEFLAAQLVRIVEAFLSSDRLEIPSLFHSDPLRSRILIALNIDLVVQHALAHCGARLEAQYLAIGVQMRDSRRSVSSVSDRSSAWAHACGEHQVVRNLDFPGDAGH